MLRLSLLILSLCLCVNTQAQNLVPNPSFEDYNECPQKLSEILYSNNYSNFKTVKAWSNPVKLSTPDYYNACATTNVSIPSNNNGYQPARTGNGYVGIIAYGKVNWSQPEYAEYVYCKLLSPLVAGEVYDVSFYVSATNVSKSYLPYGAVDRIGVRFSDTINYGNHLQTIWQDYHVRSTKGIILNDTTNWVEVSGQYIATGGEEYMVLGNLMDTSYLSIRKYEDTTLFNGFMCYYYIDDVSVTPVKQGCDTFYTRTDTLLCTNNNIMLSSSASNANSYIWSTGSNAMNISIDTPGLYWCGAVKDSCDYYIDSFFVGHYQDTVNINSDTVICLANNTTIVISASVSGASYSWNTGGTTNSITIGDTGTYTCLVKKGCTLYREVVKVTEQQFPYHIELGNDTVICDKDKSYTLGIDLQHSIIQYEWNTGARSCCITPKEEGYYQLKITDGCKTIDDTINIKFQDCSKCIMLPTAFSPNKDGKNDGLRAYALCRISRYDFRVFNRWGELVFRTDDITKPWDGTYNGKPASIGTYFYQLKYQDYNTGIIKLEKGDITLLR